VAEGWRKVDGGEGQHDGWDAGLWERERRTNLMDVDIVLNDAKDEKVRGPKKHTQRPLFFFFFSGLLNSFFLFFFFFSQHQEKKQSQTQTPNTNKRARHETFWTWDDVVEGDRARAEQKDTSG
jgi:hypothetical protein